MKKLWLLTKKNLRLLIRAKGSALIVIFAPLLLMFIIGLSFNNSAQYELNIGVHSTSFTDDVNEFINILQDEEFTITKYEESLDDCLKQIKKGSIHVCLSLPESLSVESNEAREVTFYLDRSRINLVWMIQETVKNKFNIKSQEISQGLTQNLVSKLADTKNFLSENQPVINAIKDKTSGASTSAESATSNLGGLDLKVYSSGYDVSIIDTIDADVKKGRTLLKDAQSKVSVSSLSNASKTPILVLIGNAEKELDNAISRLKGNTSPNLDSIVTDMNIELNSISTKLKTATEKISSSNNDLSSVNANLKESLASLENVQSKVDELKKKVDGVKVTQVDTITSPITTKIETVNEESTYLNYLFSSLLILVIMFSSLVLGTTLVMMEKNSPAFQRNFFLPVRKITFISSIYLTNLILNIVQITIILGISLIFLEGALEKIPAVALVLLISSSVFTFLGMIVGYLFKSEETGVLATISLGSLFLLFSGLILPLESVSAVIRNIALFNPFVLSESLVRELFLFGSTLKDVWIDLGIIVGYVVVLFLIILLIESVFHQHLVHRFMRHHHIRHRQKDKKKKSK